jgi:hypothetical protein
MGFRPSWRLPKGSRVGQRAVGNALCTAMSKAIVQAALSIRVGVPAPSTLPINHVVTVVVATEDATEADDTSASPIPSGDVERPEARKADTPRKRARVAV